MSESQGHHRLSGRSHISADVEMTGDRGYALPTSVDGQQNNDASSHRPLTHDDNANVAHFTYPELYQAAATGDVVLFQRSSEDLEFSSHVNLMQLRSPQGDTVLHIAAQHGHNELVRVILGRHDLYPLIATPNLFQNTPLHVAAASGHLSTVKILVSKMKIISQQLGASSSSTRNDPAVGDQATNVARLLLRCKNKKKNTALHLALSDRREDVARFLFEEDPEMAHWTSPELPTPLNMAAEAGYEALFEIMMRQPIGSNEIPADEVGRYRTKIVLCAIPAKKKGILNLVLRDWPEVFTTNARGQIMHPIFLAVFVGYLEGVRNILIKFRETCFFADMDDSFPIHLAAAEGHLEILEEFLKHCPDSRELRNDKSQTILHLAAKSGRAKLVSYILKNPELHMLINDKDYRGNTPLHLAAEGGHAKVVSIMTWDKRVDSKILNGEGKTALDVAEDPINWYTVPSLRQRMTWQALRNAGAPRAEDLSSLRTKLMGFQYFKRPEFQRNRSNMDFHKDRTNTLMLVSTLIVTVTFAAGLISPADSEESEPNPSMFHVFVVANTVALYSSITVVVALIWAQLGDRELVLASYKYALPVLGLALAMVSIAFMAGAYLVASNLSIWLANSVLVLGVIGFLTFLLLFAPLYSPNSFQHRFVRYIIYYPFHLLIKVTERDNKN